MWNMKIVEIIGIIILMCGVILIYDARPITKKIFGFGDQNEATKSLKIVGFILSVIGGLLILWGGKWEVRSGILGQLLRRLT